MAQLPPAPYWPRRNPRLVCSDPYRLLPRAADNDSQYGLAELLKPVTHFDSNIDCLGPTCLQGGLKAGFENLPLSAMRNRSRPSVKLVPAGKVFTGLRWTLCTTFVSDL